MSVRWDYDNDGTWDTPFLPLVASTEYTHRDTSNPIWTARCLVQDASGNSASTTASLDLSMSALIPRFPDLIAGTIVMPDTVSVGESLWALVTYGCWAALSQTGYKTEMYLDGRLWAEARICTYENELGACSTLGHPFVASVPGTYEVMFVLDAEDAIAESDELNNVAIHQLVVVPARR